MKRFILHELLLLSMKEASARRIKFDPVLNVIKGGNDTGKSSLLKSVYHTFGAEAPQLHPTWKGAEVRTAAKFSIDGTEYRILRDGKRFAMFDANDDLIEVFDSVTKGLGPYFADLFNFHLPLSTSGSEAQATPAYLFLPFYVDQDRGWVKNWDSFERLHQFQRWRSDVANFHAGVKPSEYYVAKASLSSLRAEIDDRISRRKMLDGLLRDVEKKLDVANFNVDLSAFQAEVEQLLAECNRLKSEEAKIRREMADVFAAKHSVDSQIAIAEGAAAELGKDFAFATDKLDSHVECPTCGAEYENSFSERFEIAQDEDKCRELILELRGEARSLDEKLATLKSKSEPLKSKLQSLEKLLNKRQGKVHLKDLIENEGRREIRRILSADIKELNDEIGTRELESDTYRDKMKAHEDRKRKKEINGHYLSRMKTYLNELRVMKLAETSYKRIDTSISETGSDLPRALLAYYFAMLHTISEYSTSTFCPIVIDSSRQQDQDDKNYQTMLEFMRDNQPEGSQLVVGLVDTADVKLKGKSLSLRKKYSALSKSEYDAALTEMRPLLDSVLAH